VQPILPPPSRILIANSAESALPRNLTVEEVIVTGTVVQSHRQACLCVDIGLKSEASSPWSRCWTSMACHDLNRIPSLKLGHAMDVQHCSKG